MKMFKSLKSQFSKIVPNVFTYNADQLPALFLQSEIACDLFLIFSSQLSFFSNTYNFRYDKSDQVMHFCDTNLPSVIPGRNSVTYLDADHDKEGEEHEHAGEDDVAGGPEQGGGHELTADVLDTGHLPPPHPPGDKNLPGGGVDPEDATRAEGPGGAGLHFEEA